MGESQQKAKVQQLAAMQFEQLRFVLNSIPMSRHVAIALTDLEKLEVFVKYTIAETVFPDQQ